MSTNYNKVVGICYGHHDAVILMCNFPNLSGVLLDYLFLFCTFGLVKTMGKP